MLHTKSVGCHCKDSIVVTTAACQAYKNAGYCTSYDQCKFYCPLTCGICPPCATTNNTSNGCVTEAPTTTQATTAAAVPTTSTQCVGTCTDSPLSTFDCANISLQKCRRGPGKYALHCPKTCNNCDGEHNQTRISCGNIQLVDQQLRTNIRSSCA